MDHPAIDAAMATLPEGARLLHIGPPKTGTTALQAALHAARDELERQGVHHAGRSRHSASAVEAAIGHRVRHQQAIPSTWRWRLLLREIRASRAPRVVLSSESFARATPDAIRRVVGQLDPERVQVAVTLRPLAAILPSHWQQAVSRGLRTDYEPWLRTTLRRASEASGRGFWHVQRHDELVARWADVTGVGRVTAVVLDARDPLVGMRAFEGLLGLRTGTLRPIADLENRSLTLAEAVALRALNERYVAAGLDMVVYDRVVTLGAARAMKLRRPGDDEARIRTPAWALDEAAAIQAAMVGRLRDLGVRVVGDLDTLLEPVSPAGAVAMEAAATSLDAVPVEVVGSMAMAVLEASGVTARSGQGPARDFLLGRAIEPGQVAGMPTSALLAVIANRAARAGTAPVRALLRRRH